MILFDIFRAWGSALTHLLSIAKHQAVTPADGIRIYGGSFLPTGLFFINRVYKDPIGKILLEQDHCELAIKLKDFDYLSSLPTNTLGRLYYDFYQENMMYLENTDFRDHLEKDKQRPNRPFAKQDYNRNKKVSRFFEQISYQHDLMHVIGNHPFTIEGEATVHAMLIPHIAIPAPKLIAITLAISQSCIQKDIGFFGKVWTAYRRGARAKWLYPVNWVEYLEKDIEEIRSEFKISVV